MTLAISSYADSGNFEKERVVLKVYEDLDVGKYLIFKSSIFDGKATAGSKVIYWFPDSEVKAGDLVILYTKYGIMAKKELDSGKTAHFFYWDLDEPQWGEKDTCAVLMKSGGWAIKLAYDPDAPEA
ncbi:MULTISPECIES: hypothetical protein [unclassified Delftia]|uniref:hypothetical protein n=1 Tax=unclassified Delftia TaxID=2613839 RepID=UPI001901F185|nr:MULTISPECIES: hypothetical protein [unclassified Delftia]MBK0112793.1 hypothetical protein [Delftia sp. S65]MBK0119895.1 hypothetical protein [Delftia sp. S67]MBK0131194.1 hypothetical protein [Delftia sp. S66]